MKEVYAPSDMEEMEVGISKVSRALEMQGCTGIKKKKSMQVCFHASILHRVSQGYGRGDLLSKTRRFIPNIFITSDDYVLKHPLQRPQK